MEMFAGKLRRWNGHFTIPQQCFVKEKFHNSPQHETASQWKKKKTQRRCHRLRSPFRSQLHFDSIYKLLCDNNTLFLVQFIGRRQKIDLEKYKYLHKKKISLQPPKGKSSQDTSAKSVRMTKPVTFRMIMIIKMPMMMMKNALYIWNHVNNNRNNRLVRANKSINKLSSLSYANSSRFIGS